MVGITLKQDSIMLYYLLCILYILCVNTYVYNLISYHKLKQEQIIE